MLKCFLKPLKPVLNTALHEFQERSGALQELKDNLSLYKARLPQEVGVTDALPSDSVPIEKIKKIFEAMCKQYNPEKKVAILLRICKLIYTIMEDSSGRRAWSFHCSRVHDTVRTYLVLIQREPDGLVVSSSQVVCLVQMTSCQC